MDEDALREALAEYAHESWAGWMKYLFERGQFEGRMVPFGAGEKYVQVWTMPAWAVERWTRQMNTPYSDLPESEKNSDRDEADKMLAIMEGLWTTESGDGT